MFYPKTETEMAHVRAWIGVFAAWQARWYPLVETWERDTARAHVLFRHNWREGLAAPRTPARETSCARVRPTTQPSDRAHVRAWIGVFAAWQARWYPRESNDVKIVPKQNDEVVLRNWEAGFTARKVAVWAIVQHVRDPVMGPEKHVLDVFRYAEKPLAEEVIVHLRERFPGERMELEMLKVEA